MKTIQKHWRRWSLALAAVGIGVVVRADNPCIPTTSWCSVANCTPGSISSSGTLSRTNDTICVGASSGAQASGATFNYGEKMLTCQDDCGNVWSSGPYPVAYAPTNWWEPALPDVFTNSGTFWFTNKVKGLSQDLDCPAGTDIAIVGTLQVEVVGSIPTIETQPPSQIVTRAGATVLLRVSASGCAPLNYQWKKDGVALVDGGRISGATAPTVCFLGVKPEDAGFYTVEVSNSAGTAVSTRAALVVCHGAGYIDQPLQPSQALWNDFNGSHSISFHYPTNKLIVGYKLSVSAMLVAYGAGNGYVGVEPPWECRVYTSLSTGDWPPLDRLQLHYDYSGGYNSAVLDTQRDIESQQNPLTAVSAQDYTFVFYGGLAAMARVVPIERVYVDPGCEGPPAIEFQPLNQAVPAGSSATFAVVATGSQPLTYQWRTNDVDIAGATEAAYSIASVDASHVGPYTVAVNNQFGSVTSAVAMLTIIPPPPLRITTQPRNQQVVEGDAVTFTVAAVGTAPLNYQWRHDGADIPFATGATLQIAPASLTDAGKYSVIVADGAPSSLRSAEAKLTVLPLRPPVIYRQPESQTNVVGGSVTFSVDASGTPTPSYQWYRDWQPLTGATDRSYTKTGLQSVDNGAVYRVDVFNVAGYLASSNANLVVEDELAPTITSQPTNATVPVGSDVTFSVGVSGSHPLAYQWRRDGDNIRGATGSYRYMPRVDLCDAGTYSVVVTNQFGTVTSADATLTVTPTGPPSLRRVDELKLPAVNGAYEVTLQILKDNSDATNFTVFVVDDVVSGSLVIDGSPFISGQHDTIDFHRLAVWTPPPVLVLPAPAAFRVHVSDGQSNSAPPVAVSISQKAKTRLYAWGNNWNGKLGIGTLWPQPMPWIEGSFAWQATNNIIRRDPRWRLITDPVVDQSACVFPPVPVLDLENVRSLRCDAFSVDAVAADGQLWQWGWDYLTPSLFGRVAAQADDYGRSYLWTWGQDLPPFVSYPGMAPPSPVLFSSPVKGGPAQAFTGLQSVSGGGPVAGFCRVALKENGTLWAWGYTGAGHDYLKGELGRDPGATDDLVDFRWAPSGAGFYGVSPRRVHIPGENTNSLRRVVEVQSAWNAFIARCEDHTVWWWGSMGGFCSAGWWTMDSFPGNGATAEPVRLPWLDPGTTNRPVTQLSVCQSHYVALKEDGSVWEFGYVPRLDPSGIVGVGMGPFYPIDSGPSLEQTTDAFNADPLQVTNLPAGIRSISAGDGAFGAAVTTNGEVWVWGHVLPYCTNIAPMKVDSLSRIVKVTAGWQCLLALDDRGRVWGWGENLSYMFGPSVPNSSALEDNLHLKAIRVQGLENVTDIFAGGTFYDGVAFAIGTAEEGKPTGLAARAKDQQVELTWNLYPGASQYIVYRSFNDDTNYTAIGTNSVNTFVDSGLTNLHTYYYAVSAVVNGVQTAKSIETDATPLPAPEAVQNFAAIASCRGVKLAWQAPANSSVSPPLEYRVERAQDTNGTYEFLAALRASALSYHDDSPGTNYYYHVVTWNYSGETNSAPLQPTGSEPCLPAPTVPAAWRTQTPWLCANFISPGSDNATLRWTGPTNAAGTNWTFQSYEFSRTNLDWFIDKLSSSKDAGLSYWIWTNLNETDQNPEQSQLRDPNRSLSEKLAVLIGGLNRILAAPADGQRGSIYTLARFEGASLSSATTNLLAQAGNAEGDELVRLNRMLLDDFYTWYGCSYAGYSYFASGPNWGSGLTGFRIHYRVQGNGGRIDHAYQRDVPLSAVNLGWGWFDDDGVRWVTPWEFSWLLPASAACWASVSAIVAGEESLRSNEAGPVAAYSGSWDAGLRATGGDHQVFLEWTDDPTMASYNVYCTTNTSPDPQNPADWTSVPGGSGLLVNRYWHTNLTPGITNSYKVMAYPYDGTGARDSVVVSAAALVDPTNGPITNVVFQASAYPYDSMVQVEWKPPRAQQDPDLPVASQTNWQFYLERRPAAGPDTAYQVITETGPGLAYLDLDVVNGQGYTYRVTAFDRYFNRYMTLAWLGGTNGLDTVTPTASQGLELLDPVPGNGHVNLTWSPIRAAAFTIRHALDPTGPFEVLDTLLSTDAYNSARNTYRHFGAQNGVDHYYYITATTPTGREIVSGTKSARPLATLVPLPPVGFKAVQVPDGGAGKALLTWQQREGAARYQVFLEGAGSGLWPIHQGEGATGTALLYAIPTNTATATQFTFAIRSVSQGGLASDLVETRLAYTNVTSEEATPVAKVRVAGVTNSLSVIAPTNLTLSLDTSLAAIERVTFHDNGQVLGVADSAPFQITWFRPTAGDHTVGATVQVRDTRPESYGTIFSFDAQPATVHVRVKPELAAFQTSAADLQLPAPGLPIVLSRSYSSRDATATDQTLGVGWQASWKQGVLKLSTGLAEGWAGTTVSDWLKNTLHYIADTTNHYVTLSLPGGGEAQFVPQLDYGPGGAPTLDPVLSDWLGSLTMKFEGFDASQGTLSCDILGELDVSLTAGENDPWAGTEVTLEQNGNLVHPTNWNYVTPDGTTYEFGHPIGSDGLTWLLSSIVDTNGNRLSYGYDLTHRLTNITHSCGRKVTFQYTNANEIDVFDNVLPPEGQLPVIKYMITNNQLRAVGRLTVRTNASSYEVTQYEYGNTDSGNVADANTNRLTDVFDPRGVHVLHNQYGMDAAAQQLGLNPYLGDLLSQTDAFGRTTTWTLAPGAYELTLTRSWTVNGQTTNRQVVVNHDLSGAVSSVTRPQDYSAGGPSTNTLAVQYTYGERGRPIAQTDAAGKSKRFMYDSLDHLTGQSDELGQETTSVINNFGKPDSTTDANRKTTYYGYDEQGNLLTVLEPSNARTEYTYTAPVLVNGEVVLPKLVQTESRTAPGIPYTIVTGYAYTNCGDVLEVTEKWVGSSGETVGKAIITSYEYDANGNRTAEIKSRTDLEGHVHTVRSEFTYDAQNRLLLTVLKEKVENGAYTVLQTNSVAYNLIGKQAFTTNALNRVTSYVYDALGNLVETQFPDGTVTRTVYDENNHPWTVQDKAVPVDGVTVGPATCTTYDASGRAIRVERLTGATLAVTNISDQPSRTVTSPGSSQTTSRTLYDDVGRVRYSMDARGAVTESVYDAAGRRTATLVYTNYIVSPLDTGTIAPSGGRLETSYTYDANGNQLTVTDALDRTTTSVYDSANRVVEVQFPATAEHGATSRHTVYDGLGRRTQETDEAGVATAYSYDFRGLLVQVVQDATGTNALRTSYGYDESGNQVSQTDALGRTTRFDYDALGRRTKRVLPENQSESFGYDLAGNVILHTNFNGIVITNQFDLANRMTNQVSINGYQVTWAYDPTGLRTNMTDSSGVTTLAYNEFRQLTNKTVTWSGGPTVSLGYAYDAAGAVTNIWSSTANGVNLIYQHDQLGRITNVLANGAAAAAYIFDAVGNLQSVSYGNGVTNLHQYDPRNRLTNLVSKLNAGTLASFSYQLGPTGNRTNLSESVNNTSQTYAWTYDRLYRLTQEVLNGATVGTSAYGLDPVGNRTNRVSTLGQLPTTSSSYTPNDRLVGHGYDADGNTTTASGNSYQYDPLDRLTNVNNGAVLLAYDGDGNRVSKTVGAVTTYYLVDDRNPSGYAQVLEEWTASGGTTNLSRVYNYGLGLISQQQGAGGTLSYYGLDGHGSVRFLADTSGNITDTYTYDAFGIQIASSGSTPNNYRYCGEQWDDDLGMYYQRARYYGPQIGRFWTMDSFDGAQSEPLSLHKYLYAADNPVNMWDPTGHEGNYISLGATMSLMYTFTTFELRGANAALKGARALFGGDQNVNDLIHGMDIIDIVDEKVGWVALGAGAAAGGFKVLGMFQSFLGGSAAKRIAEKALLTLQKLAPAAENLCFVAGTPIDTEWGKVPIEDIEPGDRVWSWNETSGACVLQPVVSVTKRFAQEITEIHATDSTIEATPQHPFWVQQKGWTQARDLRAGDRLLTRDGAAVNVIEALMHTTNVSVFNFEVADTHTYLVGHHPVVVHNTCPWGQRASTIPKGVPGVYVIRTSTGETYVGQAQDLFDRLVVQQHKHKDLIMDPANQLYTIEANLANWNGSAVDAIDIVEEFFIRALGAKWSSGNTQGLNRRFEVNQAEFENLIKTFGFPDMGPPTGH